MLVKALPLFIVFVSQQLRVLMGHVLVLCLVFLPHHVCTIRSTLKGHVAAPLHVTVYGCVAVNTPVVSRVKSVGSRHCVDCVCGHCCTAPG